jgi:hypothetical protein
MSCLLAWQDHEPGGRAVGRLVAQEAYLQISGANRSFGLLLVAVCAVLALLSFSRGGTAYVAFGAAALVLAIVSLTMPRVLAPLRRGWMRLGHVLGRFLNPVVLGLSFVLVIVPAGLLMRMSRRDSLALRRAPSATSYWIKREATAPDAANLKEQF